MISLSFATPFGLENPTVQNVPSWALVNQYPRNWGDLGRLPDCQPDLKNLSGGCVMNGTCGSVGHYDNAFESLLEQLQQIIHMEVQSLQSTGAFDPNDLAVSFNGLQADILAVMAEYPAAFYGPLGQPIMAPTRGNEEAWLELIDVVVEHPIMKESVHKYPQITKAREALAQHVSSGVGTIAALAVVCLVGVGIAYLGNKYIKRSQPLPALTPLAPPLMPSLPIRPQMGPNRPMLPMVPPNL